MGFVQTDPAEKAAAPRELSVVEINDGSQHRAGWLPPYPPTGICEYSLTALTKMDFNKMQGPKHRSI